MMNYNENKFIPPKLDDDFYLNFIAKNVISPDKHPSGWKAVNLENMMLRLGGTQGEIDAISQIRSLRIKVD
jgi:hypothetical protein